MKLTYDNVRDALKANGGNVSKTAPMFGMKRNKFRIRLEKRWKHLPCLLEYAAQCRKEPPFITILSALQQSGGNITEACKALNYSLTRFSKHRDVKRIREVAKQIRRIRNWDRYMKSIPPKKLFWADKVRERQLKKPEPVKHNSDVVTISPPPEYRGLYYPKDIQL